MQETSLLVYEKIKPTLSRRQRVVFDIIRQHPDISNSEIAELLGWRINQVTGRVFELREKEYVVMANKRICQVTGERVLTWKIATERKQGMLWETV